jgi:50S ribosomal protein L16 3-hydroxylase
MLHPTVSVRQTTRQDVTAMLAQWLGSLSSTEFEASCLGRAAIALPGTAASACERLSWPVLDRVLRGAPDTLVVAGGQLLDTPAPRTLAELRRNFANGVGVCIRRAERHDAGLAEVASAFSILGTAHVQVFATPGGTHGFGWHFDDEDVFIAQTAGCKDYYFRANTVVSRQSASARMFARYPRETSALYTSTLVAGDFLYMPARWWHMAICKDDALSLSVGVAR